MQVPLEWLKQYVKVEASAEEIATRLTMGGLEVEGIEESAIGPVLDVYVTPNRGDCLSMIGVAREVAALYSLPLLLPTSPPGVQRPASSAMEQTSVTIEEAALCPRYAARLVRGIQVGPSPAWMQARLEAAGQRPINNIVDVTNYVMLELGQPLHAFDLDKLTEGRIVVRLAREGETLRTLDGVERALTPSMLIIADAVRPVAVAGVMGGAETEVTETTTNLLLESAHFHMLSVRRTSRILGLRTEASYRFERVVDPDGVVRALDRVCQLLAEMGQPAAVPGVVDVYPAPILPRELTLRVPRCAELLGIPDITPAIATDCLKRLGFRVGTAGSGALRVQVPTFRADIVQEEDLVEEVGRIYGYENIPETLPVGATTRGGDSESGTFLTRIRRQLVGLGLQEVVTHSLSAPSPYGGPDDGDHRVAIRNALSEEVSRLRRSLLPLLLEVAEHNAARGVQAMALFEVGRVWEKEGTALQVVPVETLRVGGLLTGPLYPAGWQRDRTPPVADFGLARGVVEQLCASLHIPLTAITFAPPGALAESLPLFHPGRTAIVSLSDGRPVGVVGEMHPRLAAKLDLRERILLFELSVETLQAAASQEETRFRPLSRFQAVQRDLAPRLPESLPYAEVEVAVRAADAPFLEEFRLTDVYRGAPLPEGIKSLTLAFTFRAADRTLTEADVTDALSRIRAELEARCQAVFLT
jgi:phenylalanyl-tRNA synthetase beta chain